MRDLERQALTRQHLISSQRRRRVVSCSSPVSSSPDSETHSHFPFASTFISPTKSLSPDRLASNQDHRHAFAHRPRSPLSADDTAEVSLIPSLHTGRITTTITSTVSVGPDPVKPRRRSSTVTAGMGSRLLKKKDKGKEKESERTGSKDSDSNKSPSRPKQKLSLIFSDSAELDSGGTVSSVASGQSDRHPRRTSILKHVRSGSSLQKKREEHEPTSPTRVEDPSRGGVRKRLGLVRGVSVQAEKIARGLDSALDFVDGRG